jgi:nucleoside-diphosphate-sugar epimerase
MKVVITGGAGFLGRRLAAALLRRRTLCGADGRDEAIDQILVVDIVPPPAGADPRLTAVAGDIAAPDVLKTAVAGAASVFASGIVREPLDGRDAVCPVDAATRLWLWSPSTAIDCLIAAHEVPAGAIGSNRIVNAPGISVTAGEMVAALARVAGSAVATRVRWEPDPRIARIVATWPGALDTTRARALGFPGDESFDAIVRRYMDEERKGEAGKV